MVYHFVYDSDVKGLIDRLERNCFFLKDIQFKGYDAEQNAIFKAFNTAKGQFCSVKIERNMVFIDNGCSYKWVLSFKVP